MFGLIVSGRAVQTQPVVVPPNKMVFTIEEASRVQHIVVFLTGATPFPDGFGGAVYVAWPPDFASWRFLGFITSTKPSAIFRIRASPSTAAPQTMGQQSPPPGIADTAQLGVAVEPLETIEAQMAQAQYEQGSSMSTQRLAVEDRADLPGKLVQNFFEFATSYATTNPQAAAGQSNEWIPAWVLTKWYQTTTAKLQRDPNMFSNR